VVVVDDADRENEGDLIIAAEMITAEKVNFMLKHARGVLCAPITISRCQELELPHQVTENTSVLGTPFTVTVDKLEGCSTGVSAADRAATIRALADPASVPTTLAVRVMSIPCMRRIKECFVGQGIPRLPSIWPD
jgi:3,4-dihydroxy 2-butanone 4-phosphate synthase/GTP cyclohydrolase II